MKPMVLPSRTLLAGLLSALSLLTACESAVTNVVYDPRPPLPTDLKGRLAYVSSSGGASAGATGIHVMDFDRRIGFTVVAYQGREVKDLAWTPEGTRITFAARPAGGTEGWRLYSVAEDGTNAVEHFAAAGDFDLTNPSWSSSGRLAYAYTDAFGTSVFIDGEIFFGAGKSASHPVWSRDESFLFASTEGPAGNDVVRSAIEKISLEGGDITQLIQDVSPKESLDEFSHPALSPLGARFAFVTLRGDAEASEIWVMNSDGSDPVALTSDHFDAYPAWSPDADYIAFHRMRDLSDPQGTPGGIFVVRPDGSGLTQVTFDNGAYPTWTR